MGRSVMEHRSNGLLLLAVLVLYKERANDSASFHSLRRALFENSESASFLRVLVYDNSPEPQVLPTLNIDVEYVHNPKNGGPLAAYNEALERALKSNIPWVLLLDQDTDFDATFLEELGRAAASYVGQEKVAAIVPQLRCQTTPISPARRRFGRSPVVIENFSGVAPFPITALNSGSTMRVTFLREIAGVSSHFWLDCLDFLMFEELNRRGYKVAVCNATLRHGLSAIDPDRLMPTVRYENAKSAESLFVDFYRSPLERLLYDVSLLRQYVRQKMTFKNRQIPTITLRILKRRLMSSRKSRIVHSNS